MSDKKMMIGNEAVARGLYEAGCVFVSSYPGTPSTEITEFAAKYDEIYAEWAPNEKVASEAAFGACLGGGRSFSGMKHVGLNVASDLLFTAAYTGVNAGFVIAVADDQGMHSSQNEQDSRHYPPAAKVPMLEPSDSEECRAFTKLAFHLSEEFDTPVLLRLSTRVSHSQGLVSPGDREDVPLRDYVKDFAKNVMMPNTARPRHAIVERRMEKLAELADGISINKIINPGKKIGVVAAGIAYQYAFEALGDAASYLKLGMVHPLPTGLLRDFAASVDELYIIEELDDIIETHCKKLGLSVRGKKLFTPLGEYSPEMIRNRVLGAPMPGGAAHDVPGRPPVLCPGCPHRGMFFKLKSLGITVSGDIGCYDLAANPPLSAVDTSICMGASVGVLHGMNTVRGSEFAKKSVAVIGDSTFLHSGITGLIDVVYHQSPSTIIILDNSITAMTGHQQNPSTGRTLKGQPALRVDFEALCRAVGVRRIRVFDPFDLEESERALREELSAEEPSVLIAKRPCVLLPEADKNPPLSVDAEKCTRCRMCMKIACPAINLGEKSVFIDASLCVGCGLCVKLCRFGAIGGGEL